MIMKNVHTNWRGVVLIVLGITGCYLLYVVSTKKKESLDAKDLKPEIRCSPEDRTDTDFIKIVHRNESVFIPDAIALDRLSREELSALYHRYIENQQYLCKRKKRVGNIEDGGWDVCEEDKYLPRAPCLVYSFGVNNDFSFEDSVTQRYGCEVHSFDPSMGSQDYVRGDLVHFHAMGISARDEVNVHGWKLQRFGTIRSQLGHSKRHISILKLDVEKFEWQVLPDMLQSGQLTGVSNLMIEFHLALASPEQERNAYLTSLNILRGIYEQGFRIFWTTQNGWCKFISVCKGELRTNCHEVHFVQVR